MSESLAVGSGLNTGLNHNTDNMENIQWSEFISGSAVISTVLQFLTGSLICHKYIKKKSTGDSSGLPFICGFLSCSLWLCYARVTNESSIWLVNIIGSALFFLYSLVYYVFTVNKSALLKQFSVALMILMLCIGYIHSQDDVWNAKEAVGYLCCTVTVLFFAAPLTMLFHVVRVKNSESLPFPLIASTFVVSLQWVIYGVLIDDAFVQVPNFLGCLLSGVQLMLFFIYPSRAYGSGPSYKLLDETFTF